MSLGTITLHRFNGDHVYAITSAVLLPVESDGKTNLWFEVAAAPEPLQTVPDTAELGAQPAAEAVVTLDHLDLDSLAGRSFSLPSGYDAAAERQVASVYYCEHGLLNHNEIHVLARAGRSFHVRWTGTTTDVNHYDGSKPETRVEIDGQFTLSDTAS